MRHLAHRRSRRVIAALLVMLLALARAPLAQAAGDDSGSWQAQPYHLGQGLYFPQQGLRIGGYANLHYYDLQGYRATLSVRDISLFVTKDIGTRWQLFTEVEAGDALRVSGGHASSADSDFDVERLYADYHANQAVTFRVGKFLTPIGQWNLVHADPLVWTVSRPLSTTAAFARHATGAMVFGTLNVHRNDLDYWVFADDSESLGPLQDRDLAYSNFGADTTLRNNFRHALGGRLLYHMLGDTLSVGTSYISYELKEPQHSYQLIGVDFSWSGRHFSLSGEGIHRTGGGPHIPDEYGGFLEAEVPLVPRLYLVGRYERYRTSIPPETVTLETLGINYRPQPGIVLKLERRQGIDNNQLAPSGWLAAVAVLF